MTFAGDTPQLANVKAVDDSYPLYGDLQTTPPAVKPQAGTVLLAPRLMALLNLKTGDSIDVGMPRCVSPGRWCRSRIPVLTRSKWRRDY
jgi:predicted lysophospholipase L1 biosynthesis ABC-type transport system permease subunit